MDVYSVRNVGANARWSRPPLLAVVVRFARMDRKTARAMSSSRAFGQGRTAWPVLAFCVSNGSAAIFLRNQKHKGDFHERQESK
jgi:hypothetical protein